MRTPIGEMREPAVVLTPITTVDSSGGEVQGYGASDPIFVSIRAMTAREAEQFGQIDGQVSHVCFGHWPDLNGIRSDARLRLVETSQEFDIVGPPLNSPERDWTKLTLVYREND